MKRGPSKLVAAKNDIPAGTGYTIINNQDTIKTHDTRDNGSKLKELNKKARTQESKKARKQESKKARKQETIKRQETRDK